MKLLSNNKLVSFSCLLWVAFCHFAPLVAPAQLIDEFFPFGLEAGDNELPPNDDKSTSELKLTPLGFPFGARNETSLWLNNNGYASFAGASSKYHPFCEGPTVDPNERMVAVYWTDIDTLKGGHVYYRQTASATMLRKAEKDVVKKFPEMAGIRLGQIFIATWLDVAPYHGENGTSNTFQLILTTDGTLSFALMYYNKTMFSNGNKNYAKVGFDAGDGVNYVEVEGSCSDEIGKIAEMSNTGAPGKFVFRLDTSNFVIPDCVDDGSYDGASTKLLEASPAIIDTLGHVPLKLRGPCFPPTTDVVCTFKDNLQEAPLETIGIVMTLYHDRPTVYCPTPYFFGLGRTAVTIRITNTTANNSKEYSSRIIVKQSDPQLRTVPFLPVQDLYNDTGILGTNHSIYYLSWDPMFSLLQGASALDVSMIWFNDATNTMEDFMLLASHIPNNGSATVRFYGKLPSGVSKAKLARTFVVIAAYPSENPQEVLFTTEFRIFSTLIPSVFAFAASAIGLPDFQLTDLTAPYLPPCPCTATQAENDFNFLKDEMPLVVLETLHPNAVVLYRNAAPLPGTTAGQECVYNKKDKILVGAYSGGSANKYSDSVSVIGSYYHDGVPTIVYCQTGSNKTCQEFYKKRPSSNCEGYEAPRIAQGNGDPHMVTFDGTEYTFNPVGEFLLAEHVDKEFSIQARMEQYGTSSASAYTAFVIKHGSSTLQIQRILDGSRKKRSSSDSPAVEIMLNGVPMEFNDKALATQQINGELTVIAQTDDLSSVRVSLSCHMSFIFSTAQAVMAITVSAAASNRGKIRGLLGDFDGNPSNDLQLPNGTIVHADTSSLYHVHYDFGLQWMIKEEESLFVYPPGLTYANYSNPDFAPTLEFPDISTLPEEAIALCGSSIQCLYDYNLTNGDLGFANQTLNNQEKFNETLEVLEQVIPLCEELGHPLNGYTYYSTGLLEDSEATIECDPGWALENYSSRNITFVCNGTSWNGTLPTCYQLFCRDINPPSNGQISNKTYDVQPGFESVVQFSCNSGYELVGNSEISCTVEEDDGSIITWDGSVPECRELKCPEIPSIKNGYVLFSKGYALGSVATFNCDPMYYLMNSFGPATCIQFNSTSNSMHWTNPPPTCELSIAVIVGIAVGAFAVLVIAVSIIGFVIYHNRKKG